MSRRTLLRGTFAGAAVALGLPVLDAMLNDNGNALADTGGELPRRFGIFYWGNGRAPGGWTPSTTGADFNFSSSLQPLEPHRAHLSVVSGMDVKTRNLRGHHAGTAGILSGADIIPQDPGGALYASTFSRESIDQTVAREVAGETRFSSLEYGIAGTIGGGEGTTLAQLSHNGPDSVNPAEHNPRALFMRVFGPGFVNPGEPPPVDPRLSLRRQVLDAVVEDANRLSSRVGANDQRRLDQHLEGLGSLAAQIERLETMEPTLPLAACMVPTTPAESYGNEMLVEKNQAMSSVIAMALACDQTRVFSNLFSGSVSGTRYPGASGGHHQLTHDEPGDQPMVRAATRFIMERFSDLLSALKNVQEGEGTLLDRCVILASSDTADARAHSLTDYPVLVAGLGCGALRGNMHYRSSGENTSKVLLSCLHAMGIRASEYGAGGGRVTAPCSEIMR